MKKYLHGFAMCQSMFCAIPIPWNIWDEEARDAMLLFLPLVGLEIGALWALLAWGIKCLALPAPVTGVVLCLFPFLVTGFIHLDGYMDVTDAIGSCRSLDKRREILKDPHVGSFAVIGLAALLLAQFAFLMSAQGNLWVLTLIPGVSRCCCVLAVKSLTPMSSSQYAAQKKQSGHIAVVAIGLAGLIVLGFFLFGKYGFALFACMAGCALAIRKGYHSLEGMNGDISGYALTLGELAAIAVCACI